MFTATRIAELEQQLELAQQQAQKNFAALQTANAALETATQNLQTVTTERDEARANAERLTGELATASEALTSAETGREEAISSEVNKRIAAAGGVVPIARDPKAVDNPTGPKAGSPRSRLAAHFNSQSATPKN